MKIYTVNVSLIDFPEVQRIFDVSEASTFAALHKAIFKAFDRYDEHLYSFFLSRIDTDDVNTIFTEMPEVTHPVHLDDVLAFEKEGYATTKATFGQFAFKEGEIIHYLFDFGDEWWHRIHIEAIREANVKRASVKHVKSIGEAPPQYPDD